MKTLSAIITRCISGSPPDSLTALFKTEKYSPSNFTLLCKDCFDCSGSFTWQYKFWDRSHWMGRLGHAQEEYLGFTQAFKGIQAGYYWMECMSSKTKYTLNIKRN